MRTSVSIIGKQNWAHVKNNKFTPSGARLLIRVGSLRLNENHAIKGTLQELINTAEKKRRFSAIGLEVI